MQVEVPEPIEVENTSGGTASVEPNEQILKLMTTLGIDAQKTRESLKVFLTDAMCVGIYELTHLFNLIPIPTVKQLRPPCCHISAAARATATSHPIAGPQRNGRQRTAGQVMPCGRTERRSLQFQTSAQLHCRAGDAQTGHQQPFAASASSPAAATTTTALPAAATGHATAAVCRPNAALRVSVVAASHAAHPSGRAHRTGNHRLHAERPRSEQHIAVAVAQLSGDRLQRDRRPSPAAANVHHAATA